PRGRDSVEGAPRPLASRRGRRARISWGRGSRRLLVALVASLLTLSGLAGPGSAGAASSGRVAVIVRTTPGGGAAAKHAVASLGGTFRLRLKILHGFSAEIPAADLSALQGSRGVAGVTVDASLA